MKISILVGENSWAIPFAKKLFCRLKKKYIVKLISDHNKIEKGDITIFLSYEKIVKPEVLSRNRHNLVAHASDLPKGKGMSPLTWQILEGENIITVSLFEAIEQLDAGEIYDKRIIKFEGHELIDEMQNVLGELINNMVIDFFDKYPNVKGVKQTGEGYQYLRRKPEDSKLDPEKSIAEQFNLFRVVNNEKYPAFFDYRGHKYILKIYKS